MIDYEVLRFIWWLLIGILLIGFAVADGFDMGVGMLTRFLGRNDTERRIMINAIARTGTETRCGSSPRVARCSPPGRWCMRLRSPVSTWR